MMLKNALLLLGLLSATLACQSKPEPENDRSPIVQPVADTTSDPAPEAVPSPETPESVTEAAPTPAPAAPKASPRPLEAKDQPEDKPESPPPAPAPVKQEEPQTAVVEVAPPPPPPVVVESGPQIPSTQAWNELLNKHVSATGKVSYRGFQQEAAKLQGFLDELAAHPPQKDWPRAEKMAYWINAYNAFTIKLVADQYPIKSIRDLHGGNPWQVKWIKLGSATYSLDQIENEILRPQFRDARIHFAVNCAAKSCPPLLNQAFTGAQLDQLLDRQARAFINNAQYNSISAKQIEISKIFEWYAADFGNIVEYLNQYSQTKIEPKAKVTYKEYDWSLNE